MTIPCTVSELRSWDFKVRPTRSKRLHEQVRAALGAKGLPIPTPSRMSVWVVVDEGLLVHGPRLPMHLLLTCVAEPILVKVSTPVGIAAYLYAIRARRASLAHTENDAGPAITCEDPGDEQLNYLVELDKASAQLRRAETAIGEAVERLAKLEASGRGEHKGRVKRLMESLPGVQLVRQSVGIEVRASRPP